MNPPAAARTSSHRIVTVAISVAIVVAVAVLGIQAHRSSQAVPTTVSPSTPTWTPDGAVTVEQDGVLPDGVTVFDDEYVGVSNLDPELLQAVREAATDAAAEGIELEVTSGWRSPEYQEQLLRDAISEYGSEAEAARWVATADTSLHVAGDAIDVGPSAAIGWFSEHGAGYGLCQIYRNEPWHYELRPDAVDHGCPPMYSDPTEDPRLLP